MKDFLIEHFGFLRTTAYQDDGIIIGNEVILSEELEKVKDYLTSHFNSSFYDLASEKIKDKTNEILTIPKILDRINVKGNIITWDAFNTQKLNIEKLQNIKVIVLYPLN